MRYDKAQTRSSASFVLVTYVTLVLVPHRQRASPPGLQVKCLSQSLRINILWYLTLRLSTGRITSSQISTPSLLSFRVPLSNIHLPDPDHFSTSGYTLFSGAQPQTSSDFETYLLLSYHSHPITTSYIRHSTYLTQMCMMGILFDSNSNCSTNSKATIVLPYTCNLMLV